MIIIADFNNKNFLLDFTSMIIRKIGPNKWRCSEWNASAIRDGNDYKIVETSAVSTIDSESAILLAKNADKIKINF